MTCLLADAHGWWIRWASQQARAAELLVVQAHGRERVGTPHGRLSEPDCNSWAHLSRRLQEFEDLPQRREVTWQTAQGDTFLEKASDWVLGNRLRAAVSVWGISMAALIAWQARRPTAWQLKLIESRVYAQGITVASVVGLVGLEAATSSKR